MNEPLSRRERQLVAAITTLLPYVEHAQAGDLVVPPEEEVTGVRVLLSSLPPVAASLPKNWRAQIDRARRSYSRTLQDEHEAMMRLRPLLAHGPEAAVGPALDAWHEAVASLRLRLVQLEDLTTNYTLQAYPNLYQAPF